MPSGELPWVTPTLPGDMEKGKRQMRELHLCPNFGATTLWEVPIKIISLITSELLQNKGLG